VVKSAKTLPASEKTTTVKSELGWNDRDWTEAPVSDTAAVRTRRLVQRRSVHVIRENAGRNFANRPVVGEGAVLQDEPPALVAFEVVGPFEQPALHFGLILGRRLGVRHAG
jgi:hypothetical protein